MGRFYFGDIKGKFWTGVQSSDDPKNFGLLRTPLYTYIGCGCICEDINEKYCNKCYRTLEEHKKSVREKDFTKLDFFINKDDQHSCWDADDDDIEKIIEIITLIEDKIDVKKYILSITFDDSEGFFYEIKKTDELYDASHDILILIARWCLGKQILRCIEMKGYCKFYSEF